MRAGRAFASLAAGAVFAGAGVACGSSPRSALPRPVPSPETLRLHPVPALALLPRPSVIASPVASRSGVRARPAAITYVRAKAGESVAVALTAYCLTGRTRRGNPVRPGIVAADPAVFPLGSRVDVYVGGHHLGQFTVDDTGGAIRGPILDVWIGDCQAAINFGRKKGRAVLKPTPP